MLIFMIIFHMLPMAATNAETYKQGDVYGIKIDRLNFCAQKDSIVVSVDYHTDGYCRTTDSSFCFCMYAYNQQNGQWSLISGWQIDNSFVWEPDANDNYTIVVYAGEMKLSESGKVFTDDAYWQEVSRPQMGIQVTGDCAVPTSEGLLYGCTSNLNPNAADAGNYFTTCYIFSHDRQAWITQASYRASGSAWYRTAALPKGTYMMYNCTEKFMPDGSKRKLSCRYYLFHIS